MFGLAAMGQGLAGIPDTQIKGSPIGFLLLAQRRLPPATFQRPRHPPGSVTGLPQQVVGPRGPSGRAGEATWKREAPKPTWRGLRQNVPRPAPDVCAWGVRGARSSAVLDSAGVEPYSCRTDPLHGVAETFGRGGIASLARECATLFRSARRSPPDAEGPAERIAGPSAGRTVPRADPWGTQQP